MKSKSIIAVLSICFFVLFMLATPSFAAPSELKEKKGLRHAAQLQWKADEIIVQFKQGTPEDIIKKINKKEGTAVLSVSKRGKFKRLRIPKGKSVHEVVAQYNKNPHVEYAEVNSIAHALMVPNDPYYSYQWNFDSINMENAWDEQAGGNPSVIIAVIDTGVAYENYAERINKKKFKQYSLAPDLANTPFVPGYDFVNNDAHPNDDEGHGTHVTGTIAQSTNNGLGVAGIAYNTSIMPVKVLDASGSGSYTAIANGIYYAADNGADVINMSLGGSTPSTTLQNALAYAYAHGVTIVCAAGNEYEEGNPPSYPAAYDDYCIAVGAVRYDLAHAYYSNTGSYVDVAAPGGDVTVDQNGDGYGDGILQQTFDSDVNSFGYYFYQGTSMASPHVAGVAGLVVAQGASSPDEVRAALENTAVDLGIPGRDDVYGHGLINAQDAILYGHDPVHDVAVISMLAPSSAAIGDVVTVRATAENQGDFDENMTVILSNMTGTIYEIDAQSALVSAGAQHEFVFNWDTSGDSAEDHILQAEAVAVSGETDTLDNAQETTVTLEEAVHDVAIIAFDAPSEATQGDFVNLITTVQNQGTFEETTTITVRDTTTNAVLGSDVVTLTAGGVQEITVSWDTTSAALGDHALQADASVVAGETDTADNTSEVITTTIIEEQPDQNMTSAIAMGAGSRQAGKKNVFVHATATVAIENTTGGPVSGAIVNGTWSGAKASVVSGTTNAAGEVTLQSSAVKNPKSGTIFVFTINSVEKAGYVLDEAGSELEDSYIVS